ncbi:3',5'-cyclic-AMP phosphodiesterase [Acinetobacter sp. 194]|uniref:3',5'-cyclic-AMP phosphodiesterase n=1 Tax=Acinetobacter shaoyimingii TaxID=2715164 RepID=UPI001409657A|nr:3',5'-cyclic-AMP phosphodiesterase [Acinetobacter shaoyimingii]NHB59179.1 3',5'-cyclic-AMP phosphodiesterase [Acinetobacter shaoyimingii]
MGSDEKQLEVKEKIIIQITDTHLMDDPNADFVQVNPEQSFHAVIEDILAKFPHIDAIVHTGDLAQVAKPETYQRYQAFMAKLNIPFYQVPGNHDHPAFFPFYQPEPNVGVLSFGNWRICLINTAVHGKIDGWIQSEQLQQLKIILQNQQNTHVILACHHHPLDMQSKWIDRHKLKNTHELQQILTEFDNIKLVICGHVHQDSLHVWKTIQFFSTPSTSVQFKPLSDDFALDNIAPGYRSLHLKENGEFTTQVHRLQNFVQHINKEISGY